MFDFFRKHTRVLQFLLVLLIFPSFVFFGIQGYSRNCNTRVCLRKKSNIKSLCQQAERLPAALEGGNGCARHLNRTAVRPQKQ